LLILHNSAFAVSIFAVDSILIHGFNW